MSGSHKVDALEMGRFFESHTVVGASATTVDRTQRKRLSCRGGITFVVDRYFAGEDNGWQELYAGPDLAYATRLYNDLG